MNYPFNQNAGELLGKRKYINRKLDEIKNKMIELGWIQEDYTNEYVDENDYSSGALLPYRQDVNDKLDYYESIINQYAYSNDYSNDYTEPLQQVQPPQQPPQQPQYKPQYQQPYRPQYQPSQPSQPSAQPQAAPPKTQEDLERQFRLNFANAFGLSNK
jgi:hypothetical protein